MIADYIIVGSGLTGATIARHLKDAGKSVLVIERRAHLGGNVHDHTHPSGIRIHTYGPHYFRTNCDRIWYFVQRFDEFYHYEARVQTQADGRQWQWPLTSQALEAVGGVNWKPAFTGEPLNFEEACLKMMPAKAYDLFVRNYTEKQWGIRASGLDARLASRFDIRSDGDSRLSRHKYQGLPVNGYAHLMTEMLRGIPVILNCDYLKHRNEFIANKKTIYTGPIDEYFGFDLRMLEYRGQRREHTYDPENPVHQNAVQVNYPSLNFDHIRIIEWKHLMPEELRNRIKGTVITKEVPFTPSNPSDYEYPFPSQMNQDVYKQYAERAAKIPNFIVAGRLGFYKYFDMDQAIGAAMKISDDLLNTP